VFSESGVDRRYYELCALTEIRNALRSGDIWVPGQPAKARRFKAYSRGGLWICAALWRTDELTDMEKC
jgi:hypothetical protein